MVPLPDDEAEELFGYVPDNARRCCVIQYTARLTQEWPDYDSLPEDD